jgi:hypothetical protein
VSFFARLPSSENNPCPAWIHHAHHTHLGVCRREYRPDIVIDPTTEGLGSCTRGNWQKWQVGRLKPSSRPRLIPYQGPVSTGDWFSVRKKKEGRPANRSVTMMGWSRDGHRRRLAQGKGEGDEDMDVEYGVKCTVDRGILARRPQVPNQLSVFCWLFLVGRLDCLVNYMVQFSVHCSQRDYPGLWGTLISRCGCSSVGSKYSGTVYKYLQGLCERERTSSSVENTLKTSKCNRVQSLYW